MSNLVQSIVGNVRRRGLMGNDFYVAIEGNNVEMGLGVCPKGKSGINCDNQVDGFELEGLLNLFLGKF